MPAAIPTGSKHWVEQEDPAIRDVFRKLIVEKLGLSRFLVPLDKDLANPHRPAAVSQTLFHGLACAHDRNATDLALEHQTFVSTPDRRCHIMLYHGQMIETLFNQESDDSIGVEDEVCALRIFVADHAVGCQPPEPRSSDAMTDLRSAMSCGVCGRTLTLSRPTSTESVALGRSPLPWKSGPTHGEGSGPGDGPSDIVIEISSKSELIRKELNCDVQHLS